MKNYINEMKKIMQILSSPADEQMNYIEDMSVDELGLEFDDIYLMLQINNFKELKEKEKEIVNKLNNLFNKMSKNKFLWTKKSLNESLEWKEVRKLAKEFLL